MILKRFLFLFFLVFFLLPPTDARALNNLLAITPASSQRQVGDLFALEIKISAGEKILGADLDIFYDQNVLSFQKITPADFFVNPQILTEKTDPKRGLVSYSIFSYPTRQDTGTVAVLTFKAIKETTESAKISFGPETVLSTVGEKLVQFETKPALMEIKKKTDFIPTQTQAVITPAFSSPTPSPAGQVSPTPAPTSPMAKFFAVILLVVGVIVLIIALVIL